MSSSRIASTSMASTSTNDEDVLMSKEHKAILREFRDQLVDNMYPDDILNQLQSLKVLTHRDTTRIKEKTSAEAMNESLLDILMRKPDRAFGEFINSLRESDQNHVANIIDKNRESTPKEKRDQRKSTAALSEDEEDYTSTNRKRKHGEIGVRLKVGKLEFDEEETEENETTQQRKRRPLLEFEELDTEQERIKKRLDIKLLKVISKEVDNLDRVVSSGLTQTSMAMRRAALETIRELQKHRREITGVDFGSVIFRIVSRSVSALQDLRELCDSGRLAAMAERILTKDVLRQFRLRKATLSVSIDPEEFDLCLKELRGSSDFDDVENRNPDLMTGQRTWESKFNSTMKEGYTSPLPHSSDQTDLDLVKYLSLRSPPHTPSNIEDCKHLSAEETLVALGVSSQLPLLSAKRVSEQYLRDSAERLESRGRSPIRRRNGKHMKGKLKFPKKSLSLSPMPISRQTRMTVTRPTSANSPDLKYT